MPYPQVSRLLRYAILSGAVTLIANFTYAEVPSHPILGEYVVEVSTSKPLRVIAKSDITRAVGKPISVKEEGHHILVLRESSADICKKILQHHRAALRAKNKIQSKSIVRRYSCSSNELLTINGAPNDPYYGYETALNQSSNLDINAPEAWALSTGSSDVVVAVIDTGVDYTHADLSANVWTNPSEVGGNGLDDDGDGVVDDIHGFNAVANNGDPLDDNGHGTHVSGTIGAVGNNGVGVTGINWNIKIIGAKFLDSSGSGTTAGAINAIDYITRLKNRGVNIVATNNSWGGGGYSAPLQDAISRAGAAGIVFVAAAGNNGQNLDTTPSYPASYSNSNIISVAALDASTGNLASFSNYGQTGVDIAAPGVNILSTYKGNQYAYMSGTSMATPHVTGVIALMKAYNPLIGMNDIVSCMVSSSRQLSSLTGKVATGGLLQADGALRCAAAIATPTPTPTVTPTVTPTPPSTPTPSPSATPSLTPTPTPIPPTPTPTPLPSPTLTPTPSPIPSATPKPTPSVKSWTVSGSLRNYSGGALSASVVAALANLGAKSPYLEVYNLKTRSITNVSFDPRNFSYSFATQEGSYVVSLKDNSSKLSLHPLPPRYTVALTKNYSGMNFRINPILNGKALMRSKREFTRTK